MILHHVWVLPHIHTHDQYCYFHYTQKKYMCSNIATIKICFPLYIKISQAIVRRTCPCRTDNGFTLIMKSILVAQLCPTLFHSLGCSLPRSSVHGILQARIVEWVDIPFSRGSSRPRDWTWVSCIAGRFFTIWATREALMIPNLATSNMYQSNCWGLNSEGQIEWTSQHAVDLRLKVKDLESCSQTLWHVRITTESHGCRSQISVVFENPRWFPCEAKFDKYCLSHLHYGI